MEKLLPKTGYRKRIVSAVEDDDEHPINCGIKMQAHHLVSAEGVRIATLGSKLKGLGYSINVLENLVLLPSTLQGACHLKVQLHRGNHTFEDDDHPESYHKLVFRYLDDIRGVIQKCSSCGTAAEKRKTTKKIQKSVDDISFELLEDIKDFEIPLTSIFKKFSPNSSVGCSNSDGIPEASDSSCNVERNHNRNQSDGQIEEKITYVGEIPYELEVGK